MNDTEITSWTVFGERGSGTRWVSDLMGSMTRCVNLTDSYVSGWKHGLWGLRQENQLGPRNLVIHVTKDPYAWLLSFYNAPWHCQHLARGISFSEFIRNEYWAKCNDTKHREWWGLDRDDELPERPDNERWSNPIQMWRDKEASFQKIENKPVLMLDYITLLKDPVSLAYDIKKLGAELKDFKIKDPKKYKKYSYYRDYLFMEMIPEDDRNFIAQELDKPLSLRP